MAAPGPRCDHRPIEPNPLPPESHRRRRGFRRHGLRPQARGPFRRDTGDRVLAGVAGGIARRYGWDPTIVRVVILLMAFGGGTGVVGYTAAWLFLPADGDETSIGQRALRDRRAIAVALATGIALVAVLLAISAVGLSYAGSFMWPLAIGAGGLAIIWLDAEDHDRDAIRRLTGQLPDLPGFEGRSRVVGIVRAAFGGAMIIAGIVGLVIINHSSHGSVGLAVSVASGILGGFAVLFGPFWLRIASDLTEERRARVRSQEQIGRAHV